MMKRTTIGILTLLFGATAAVSAQPRSGGNSIDVLIRCDDAGMSHAVNSAFRELAASGLPFSASVMVPCPWFAEAVEILKSCPNVSVGLHLTLNAEWNELRWGPVSGAAAVPSLVDSLGNFFPSRAALMAHGPVLAEVEFELRAQIQRALRAGLRPDYVDYHMGAAVGTPELRGIVERLAAEFNLGVSRYFGEVDVEGVYRTLPANKLDTLLALVGRLKPGPRNLLVFHIGEDTPELEALSDLNAFGLPDMAKHRNGEFRALMSPKLREKLSAMNIRTLTYKDLIRMDGLAGMRRPAAE